MRWPHKECKRHIPFSDGGTAREIVEEHPIHPHLVPILSRHHLNRHRLALVQESTTEAMMSPEKALRSEIRRVRAPLEPHDRSPFTA